MSAIILTYKNKKSLVSSSSDGYLRIWDYNHPEIILHKIQTYSNKWIIGLELINERYLLGACGDGTIKEFDLKKDYVAVSLDRINNDPLFVVKYININGEKYLFTHSFKGIIELWKEY